jgi:hypothetical protein
LVWEQLGRVDNVRLHADLSIRMVAIDDFNGFPGSNDHSPPPLVKLQSVGQV